MPKIYAITDPVTQIKDLAESNYAALFYKTVQNVGRWNQNAPLGSAVTISYSFADIQPVYSSEITEFKTTPFKKMDEVLRNVARHIFEEVSHFTGISFVEKPNASVDNVDIMISGTVGGGGRSYTPGTADFKPNYGGDIFIDIARLSDGKGYDAYQVQDFLGDGSYSDFTRVFTHELGHALGLMHPRNYPVLNQVMQTPNSDGYAVAIEPSIDNAIYSIMSYILLEQVQTPPGQFFSGHFENPVSFMYLDILALQELYGTNPSYSAGDDVYQFPAYNIEFKTIWDAGGSNTFDLSLQRRSTYIDIRDGGISSIGISAPPGFKELNYDKNIVIGPNTLIKNVIGSSYDDFIIGNDAANNIKAGGGNDTVLAGRGNDVVDGGIGQDTLIYTQALNQYTIQRTGTTYSVRSKTGGDGTDSLTNIETLKFTDMSVNLMVQNIAASAPQANVQRLIELYVAFFNRVPDADGLAYWIGEMKAGQSINQISSTFYNAGLQYSDVTGFKANMSNADFINLVYKNVLGRIDGADKDGLEYWSTQLSTGIATRGSLVSTILDSAHGFKGDANWGWVASLLDNKIEVAQIFAVNLGLNYLTPDDSIKNGMAIAAAVTPTDITAAVKLIGITPQDFQLM